MAEPAAPTILACLEWAPLRVEVDPLTGAWAPDDRFCGPSPADRAALEWALRLGEAWGWPVHAASVGPAPAERMLRDCLAAGAAAATRLDAPAGHPSTAVADALAGLAAAIGASLVVCGDWSLDRGTGSVPPFLAACLRTEQACGLVSLAAGEPGELTAERRLDGGRRERLAVRCPAVISVEGGSASLRRAPLAGVLRAGAQPVATRAAPPAPAGPVRVARTLPYRPPARVTAPPRGEARQRIEALTGAMADRTPPQRLVLDPPAAAERILAQLEAWGYR